MFQRCNILVIIDDLAFFQVLEKALEECGDDLDLAIKSLNELRLGCAANKLENAATNHFDVPTQANGLPQGTYD